MREIKFRGFSETLNKWVIGVPYFSEGNWWILVDENTKSEDIGTGSYFVDKSSIGQYTGLKDKNEVEIYEYMEIDDNFEVSFKDGCYILTNISNGDIMLLYNYLRDKNGQVTVTKEYTKI